MHLIELNGNTNIYITVCRKKLISLVFFCAMYAIAAYSIHIKACLIIRSHIVHIIMNGHVFIGLCCLYGGTADADAGAAILIFRGCEWLES